MRYLDIDSCKLNCDEPKMKHNLKGEYMEDKKITVKGGRYCGEKWFLGLNYKFIQTDIKFMEDKILLSQCEGHIKAQKAIESKIMYRDIMAVNLTKKFCIPNVIVACIACVVGICIKNLAIFVPAALMFLVGRHIYVQITYSGGVYDILTENSENAEDLKTKIELAINQWRKCL